MLNILNMVIANLCRNDSTDSCRDDPGRLISPGGNISDIDCLEDASKRRPNI